MKKSPSGINRGKPPSIRTPSYHNTKQRGHLNVDRSAFHLPSLQHTPERLVSMSENPEMQDSRETISALRFSSKEVSDCMSHWLTFLKVLQTVCTAGAELTESIGSLGCTTTASGCKNRLEHCRAMWDHLAAATNSAVAIVRNQTIASLQEAHVGTDIDQDQLEINQGVICSGLVRLLNLQYQLGMASCDWISSSGVGVSCSCGGGPSGRELDAVARCYAVRTPTAPVPVEPLQRRWSEAATATHDKAQHDPTLRRWSIPWKLALPTTQHHEKSRSTTPDAVWHSTLASQEDLQDVISLLSCRPANTNSQHLPGVILTRAEGQNPDNVPKSIMHRGSWWGEAEEADAQSLASRKSSSSTDTTSSCYSLHKSATTSSEELSHGRGGTGSHLYSMWSGTDLPFIKLTESSEQGDAT